MKLSVLGCGYLGAVHACAMASMGHEVVGFDVSVDRIATLSSGTAPFYEPELEDLLTEGLSSGKLTFTTDVKDLETSTVHFLTVGTPQKENGTAADLTQVYAAVNSLIPLLTAESIIIGKSTVPVGTAQKLATMIRPTGARLVWNPEFLREGWAVRDTILPDRIVVGTGASTEDKSAAQVVRQIYQRQITTGTPYIETDFATAELVKVAANAFLATKISFINAMAEISDAVGADVVQLADALGHDTRIGRKFLGAGIGFGGGCLPKDIRAFIATADQLGVGESLNFLKEVDLINQRRRTHVVNMVTQALGGEVRNKRVAVLGASFKPHSDDIRDSPALEVAIRLHNKGADVIVTDPVAIDKARKGAPQLTFEQSRDLAIQNADVIVVATEWDEYRGQLDPEQVSDLTDGRIIVDCRNALTPGDWISCGWQYFGMGRR
ncbi:UDP-glucose dehydrogenase family protein [Microbacterium sp. YY-01]|uniref:UDP-glucose dehydrogenase family protein n=1 Tax=Microbacterium sp. YY-01 TaxID=3421634 RepID=UPI003D1657F7